MSEGPNLLHSSPLTSENASPTTVSDEDFTTSTSGMEGEGGWPFDIDRYVNTLDLEGRVIEVEVNESEEPSE